MKHKAIGIQDKPEVDVDKLDQLEKEEAAKAAAIAAKAEEETPGENEPENNPATPEPVIPPIDYKEKFKESQKEALILKKQIEKAEEEKNKKVEITDDYLKGIYLDWEDMTANEQLALRKAEELKQDVQELKNNANKFNNDREWNEKVDAYITEELPDVFPKIVGREDEFKRFATRPTRKGLPMDDLAKIFLFENPTIEPKRSLFHAPGSAGKPPEDEGMSAEDVKTLRIQRPLEYMRLVREGKIKIKI